MRINLVIIIILFICTGCILLGKGEAKTNPNEAKTEVQSEVYINLPAPKLIPEKEFLKQENTRDLAVSSAPEESLAPNGSIKGNIQKMLAQLVIVCGDMVEKCAEYNNKDYSNALHEVVVFLIENFGKARYKGIVKINVSRDPNVNGTTLWRTQKSNTRLVYINEINFEKTEWKVLVHELFHAFYQNSNFISHNSDFIVEGLATYAEYKYRYAGKSNSEISDIMKSHAEALGYPKYPSQLDYDAPFGLYEGRNLDLLYIISGLFFMRQSENEIHLKITKMIDEKNIYKKSRYISVREVIKYFSLTNNEFSSIPQPLPSMQVLKNGGAKQNSKKTDDNKNEFGLCNQLNKYIRNVIWGCH